MDQEGVGQACLSIYSGDATSQLWTKPPLDMV